MDKKLFKALKGADEIRGVEKATSCEKTVNVTLFVTEDRSVVCVKGGDEKKSASKSGEKYSTLKQIIEEKRKEVRKSDFSVLVMIGSEKDGAYRLTRWVEPSPLVNISEDGTADFGEPVEICLNRAEYQAVAASRIALFSNSTGILYALMPESFNSCGRLLSCAGAFRFGKEGIPLASAMMLSEAFISADRRVNLCYESIRGSSRVRKVTAVVGKRFFYMTNVELIDLVSDEISRDHLCHIDSWHVDDSDIDVRFKIDSGKLNEYDIFIDVHSDSSKSCVSSVLEFSDVDVPMTVRTMTFNRNAKEQEDNLMKLKDDIASVDDVPDEYEENKAKHLDSEKRREVIDEVKKCLGVKAFRKISGSIPEGNQNPNDFAKEIMKRSFGLCSKWSKPKLSGVYYKAFKGGM